MPRSSYLVQLPTIPRCATCLPWSFMQQPTWRQPIHTYLPWSFMQLQQRMWQQDNRVVRKQVRAYAWRRGTSLQW